MASGFRLHVLVLAAWLCVAPRLGQTQAIDDACFAQPDPPCLLGLAITTLDGVADEAFRRELRLLFLGGLTSEDVSLYEGIAPFGIIPFQRRDVISGTRLRSSGTFFERLYTEIIEEARSRVGSDANSNPYLRHAVARAMALAGRADEAIRMYEYSQDTCTRIDIFLIAAEARAMTSINSGNRFIDVAQSIVPDRDHYCGSHLSLFNIAVAQARIGVHANALSTARAISRGIARSYALLPVARAQANAGLQGLALQTLNEARSSSGNLLLVEANAAEIQAELGLGVVDAALDSLVALTADANFRRLPEETREAVLGQLAIAQAAAGRDAASIAMAMEIGNPVIQTAVLSEIARAQSRSGRSGSARATIRLAGSVARAIGVASPTHRDVALLWNAEALAKIGLAAEAVATSREIGRLELRASAFAVIAWAMRSVEAAPTVRTRPAEVQAAAASPAAAPSVRGSAQVLSTARFIISGRTINLAYIEGLEGPHAQGIAAFIASRGGTVVCEPLMTTSGLRCKMEDGVDLAAAALFNGAARAAPDAPPEYRALEEAARQAGRGVWAGVQ